MAADAVVKERLQHFVEALQALAAFDTSLYSKRLLQASQIPLSPYFPHFQPADVGQQNFTFDGQDCRDHVHILAASSTARCLATVGDNYGFHSSVDQDKAIELSKKTIGRLISFMYGDHVNNHLKTKTGLDLNQLRQDAIFVEAYHRLLLSSPFDHNALSQNVGRNYTIALLFCYEYFKHGPGFELSEVLTAESEDMKHWVQIFRSWIVHSQDAEFKKKNPNFKVESLIPSAGAIVRLHGYPDQDIQALAQHLQERAVGDFIKWEISEDIKQYELLGQIIWASWDSATANYENAVLAAVHDKKSDFIPGYSRPNAPNAGSTREMFGENVDKYMQDFWGTGLFKNRANNRVRITVNSGFGGACFKPGTQVITSAGSKNIEDLVEGDSVLTRGGEYQQWGCCSDEQVIHPTTSKTGCMQLFGFNGDSPFFSANHVFYTTTGLRALDPILAKTENPWLDVGRLKVGHSVIRIGGASSYNPVLIDNFTSAAADCSAIYGVHLREGLRSYHANGYLVHLNYPEITIKSISGLLKGFDPSTRQSLLQHMSELQPLFDRFGIQTLMQALERQLQDDYVDRHPLQPLLVAESKSRLDNNAAEHLRRSWELQDEGNFSDPSIELPSVDIFEGVVTIDGSYCPNASVKDDLIAWSRKLPASGWEHGYVRLDDSFMIGSGSIFYSPDFESFVNSNGRRVIAMPTKRYVPPELIAQNTITHPSIKTLLGNDSTAPLLLAKPGTFSSSQVISVLSEGFAAAAPQQEFSGFAAEMIPEEEGTMAEADQEKAIDAVELQKSMMSSMEAYAQMTASSSAIFTEQITPAVAQAWQELDNYVICYDQSGWSDTNAVVTSPQPYCQMFTSIDDESTTYLSRIPELDAIRDAAFAQAQAKDSFAEVAELYLCHKTKDTVSKNAIYEFRCVRPQLIAQLADDFDYTAPRFENLTFKNLGLDIKIPFIFSAMQVTFSFDGQDVTGIVRAYDPNMRGEDGKRFRIMGQWTDTPETIVRAATARMTVNNAETASLDQLTSAHVSPSSQITFEATIPNAAPISDKMGAKELSDMKPNSAADVHEKTQRLIYNSMRYWMTAADHDSFIGSDKPGIGLNDYSKVPNELGPGLEAGTVKWLQEKYIPAWISVRICQIADVDKNLFRKSLNSSQRKKLNYWWNGKGKDCMTQSDYYNRLNALAARYATLWALPRLQTFVDDTNHGDYKPDVLPSKKKVPVSGAAPATKTKEKPEMRKVDTTILTGGKRWAAALFNSKGAGPAMHDLAQQLGDYDKNENNPIKTIGNILQVLDPIPIATPNEGWTDDNQPFCTRLTENIRRYRTKIGLTIPYAGVSSDPFIQNEYLFLYDGLGALWENLLEEKPGFDDELTLQIRNDLKKMQKELEIDAAWLAAFKAKTMLELMQEMVKSASIFTRANRDFSISQKVGTKWNGLCGKGAAGSVATADYAMETTAFKEITDEFKAAKLKALMYSSIVVVTLGMYIGAAVAAYKSWDTLDPVDRGKLVLGSVQQAIVSLGQSKDAYNAFLDYKAGKNRYIAAAAIESSLSQDMKLAENQIMDLFGEEFAFSADFRLKNIAGEMPNRQIEARVVELEMAEAQERGAVENIQSEEKSKFSDPDAGGNPKGLGKKYNWKGNLFKIALVAIGAALVVFECFSIYRNWGNMDAVTASMSIANVVVQALSVLVEGIVLAADIGFTIAGPLLTVCSFAGPVLAIVGVVIVLVMYIMAACQPPPLTPSENWMKDRGYKFVGSLPDPEHTRLTWLIQPTKLQPSSDGQSLVIIGTNETSAKVELAQVSTSFTSGTSKSCLFADDSFSVPNASASTGLPGPTGRFECKASSQKLRDRLNFAQLQGPPVFGDAIAGGKNEKQITWHLFVKPKIVPPADEKASQSDTPPTIVLEAGEWMSITITGKTGPPYENDFYAEVTETSLKGDTVLESQYINRK